jgi:hypothetical protein
LFLASRSLHRKGIASTTQSGPDDRGQLRKIAAHHEQMGSRNGIFYFTIMAKDFSLSLL